MRGHRNAVVGAGEADAALGYAAESLRLADGEIELAVMHRRRDGGAAELGVCDLDACGGEPKIEVEIVESVERDWQLIPVALVPGSELYAGHIGRQVER